MAKCYNEYEERARSLKRALQAMERIISGNPYNAVDFTLLMKRGMEMCAAACVSAKMYNNDYFDAVHSKDVRCWLEQSGYYDLYKKLSEECWNNPAMKVLIGNTLDFMDYAFNELNSIEFKKNKHYMKKWWLSKEVAPNIWFKGWVNTIHNCAYNDLPENISGTFYAEFYPDGTMSGKFKLDEILDFMEAEESYLVFGSLKNENYFPPRDEPFYPRFDGDLAECNVKEYNSVMEL